MYKTDSDVLVKMPVANNVLNANEEIRKAAIRFPNTVKIIGQKAPNNNRVNRRVHGSRPNKPRSGPQLRVRMAKESGSTRHKTSKRWRNSTPKTTTNNRLAVGVTKATAFRGTKTKTGDGVRAGSGRDWSERLGLIRRRGHRPAVRGLRVGGNGRRLPLQVQKDGGGCHLHLGGEGPPRRAFPRRRCGGAAEVRPRRFGMEPWAGLILPVEGGGPHPLQQPAARGGGGRRGGVADPQPGPQEASKR